MSGTPAPGPLNAGVESPNVPEEGVLESRDTRIGGQIDGYLSALGAGNFQNATETAVAIDSALPPTGDLLSELVSAVGQNYTPKVRLLRRQLRQGYDERAVAETARTERAGIWAEYGPVDPSDKALSQVGLFAERAKMISAQRLNLFLTATPLRSLQINQERRKRLRNVAAQLAQREQLLADAASDAMAVLTGTDLPAAISVLRAEQAGSEFPVEGTGRIELVVGNVGDGTASNVGMTVTADAASVTPQAVDVGELDGMTKVEIPLDVSVTEAGTYTVRVELTSGNAGVDSATASVEASETALSVGSAYDRNGSGHLNTREIQQAVADFEADEPVPGTESQTLNAEALRGLLVAWAYDQPI